MSAQEETIDATLDTNGQLWLSHLPQVHPGPVVVTIRATGGIAPLRGLADVVREIAAEQRLRGFPGRSAAEVQAESNAQLVEDLERDRELSAARRVVSQEGQ